MKKTAIVSILAAVLAAGAASAHDMRTQWGTPQAHSHPQPRAHSHPNARVIERTIRINCFRGPIRETVWDHPRAVFLDDLVAFGYSYVEAQAIGMRICRDVTAVGKPGAMTENLQRVIAETPPGFMARGHGHN